MTTKQKYYVLENGEYVLKYKDSNQEAFQNQSSTQRVLNPPAQREKRQTPRTSRNITENKNHLLQSHNKKIFSSNRPITEDITNSPNLSDYHTFIGKHPEERLCYITLQLNSRIKSLEEENNSLIHQNRRLSSQIGFRIKKGNDSNEKIIALQNQIQEIRCSYKEQMEHYHDLCIAYEALAEENRQLSDSIKLDDSRSQSLAKSKTSYGYKETTHFQGINEQEGNTLRTYVADDMLHKAQSKIQKHLLELQLLKQQMAQKDEQISQLADQLRVTETNLSNSRLTEDFLVSELQKTKAIIQNQKLLQQALNEKILRILQDVKSKQSILLSDICGECKMAFRQARDKSQYRPFQNTKMDSDSEQYTFC